LLENTDWHLFICIKTDFLKIEKNGVKRRKPEKISGFSVGIIAPPSICARAKIARLAAYKRA